MFYLSFFLDANRIPHIIIAKACLPEIIEQILMGFICKNQHTFVSFHGRYYIFLFSTNIQKVMAKVKAK